MYEEDVDLLDEEPILKWVDYREQQAEEEGWDVKTVGCVRFCKGIVRWLRSD